ncbi:MAG TPA: hypothetical protein VFV66_08135 [Nonomuraea sp.]|nr:hypothetical protein [Nonomuraea sp.]
MAGARTRATAVSAIVLALGLAGAGAMPFIMQSASASVTAADPVEPCDANDPACQTDPQTTVTVTTTLGTPTPGDVPETTITRTVTAAPTRTTKNPSPTKSTPPKTTSTPPPPATQNPQPIPSQSVESPPSVAPSTSEPPPSFPSITPESSAPVVPPSQTQAASSEEVPLELRNAAPEFDQRTLTQKLSIPALVLVLLALFAVLIFEGRLRRMAHAAAVRKAGPLGGRPDLPPPPPGGYPAGPGYASAGGFPGAAYPGGTAYAPIISFVPVQTYPTGPVQYGAVYQEPGHPYPPQGYAQEPPSPAPEPPPVVLHPDEFDSYPHEPAPASQPREYRDPFEPLVPPADIPPGGAGPYDDGSDHPLGHAPVAEPGDAEPWSGSLFQPARRPAEYEPPPYLPADEEATAVQPLPEERQDRTKAMPDSERDRFLLGE